ncbi:hypothetical protein [Larkinella sp.]
MKSHQIILRFSRWVDRNDQKVLALFYAVFVLALALSFIVAPFTELWKP